MTQKHLMLGTVSSFLLAAACLFGSTHLGAAGVVVAMIGVGLFVLSMVGLVAYRVVGVVSVLRRRL